MRDGRGCCVSKTRERRLICCRCTYSDSYSVILIFLETLIARQSLRPNTSNSPLAIVYKQSKHLRQTKQTLQQKQSCVQEQSFALVTWFYRYGFVSVFLFCIVVRFSSILNSFCHNACRDRK